MTEKEFEDIFEAALQADRKVLHDELFGALKKAGVIEAGAGASGASGGDAKERDEVTEIIKSATAEVFEEQIKQLREEQAEAEIRKSEKEQARESIKELIRETMAPQLEEIRKSFKAPSNLNDVEEIRKTSDKKHYLAGIL